MSYLNLDSAQELGDPKPSYEARVSQLAKWPDEAHASWKKLSAATRKRVVEQMGVRYGSGFAKQFLEHIGKRSPKNFVERYYGPGVGPAPVTLKGRGYKLAQKDSVHEWWVHPTGERVTRNFTGSSSTTSSSTTAPRRPESVCKDVDTFTDAICSNTDRICKLAEQVNDDTSQAACQRARTSCASARTRSQSCRSLQGSLGDFGQFQLLDAGTCPPAGFTMAQATRIVRRSIAVSIGILKSAASKLESIEQKRITGQPRSEEDKRVAKLFLFFFRHDPNRPIPWAGNKASGANVAHRLRKAALALVKRGLHYRCACPGAPATRRGQAAPGGIHIDLCNAFWNVPAGLRMDAETFRAGVILHEALHVIYDSIDDAGAHRANDHCYEAFAMRAAGHAADRSDVEQCRPDRFP